MPFGAMGEYFDVAQLTLYLFWLFFAGLIFWIRREDRREGYPLEQPNSGIINRPGHLLIPKPKEFRLQDGTVVKAPNFDERDNERPMSLEKINGMPGAPSRPTGDPMDDGVGPAAWVPRRDAPEKTREGHPLIVPMRLLEGFEVAKQSTDPRGLPVMGADGEAGGTVKELWIDRADQMVRYLEVEIEGGETVLLPMQNVRLNVLKERIEVNSILGAHFPKVPRIASNEQITAAEEERIWAYYAGGRMYAEPSRQEPFV